jgi:Tol biopolymer transport system component
MRVVPFSSYPGSQRWPAFSPDGNQLAFSWTGEHGDVMHIYVKVIGTETPLQLTSAANSDVTPVWAPDGRAIYFLRSIQPGVSIFQVSPLGGKERLVASFAGAGTLRITPDGKWLLLSGQESPEEKSSSVYVVSTNSDVRRKGRRVRDRSKAGSERSAGNLETPPRPVDTLGVDCGFP